MIPLPPVSLRRFPRLICVWLLLFFVSAAGTFASVDSEIETILARSGVSGNTWSISIERENGDVIYSRSPATGRRPASVTKLFTTAAAFDLLGPSYSWNGTRLDQACRTINRASDNDMADDLFRHLGATLGTAYSYSEGSRIVRNWAASIGMNTSGLILNDGSGLSYGNRISPDQVLYLLRYTLGKYSTFAPTLSRACSYGTLGSRFCGTAASGNLYGKTGTLPNGQTVSLAGYLDHSGKRYFFSFFANSATNVTASRQAIDDAILVLTTDALISTTFAGGDWLRTTANSLNMRAGPGTSHAVLASLPQDTIIRVQPDENNGLRTDNHHWWLARVHPDGPEGWLAETHMEPAAPPADWPWSDIFVDNSDPGFRASANWTTASWANDKYGSNYHYRGTENINDSARWSAELPGSGSYDVYAWWTADKVNRATATPYFINHAAGMASVPADQTANGGRWNYLGRYLFDHDSVNQVILSPATSSGTRVIADAVRFVPIDIEPPPQFFALSIEVDGPGQVTRSPEADEYEDGQSLELLAVPDPEYSFVGWTGDKKTLENPLAMMMDKPVTLTAAFRRTYEAWAQAHFTEEEQQNPDISGEHADPNGDNVPNLMKYALGLDPHEVVASILPLPVLRTVREGGADVFLTVTFSHPSDVSDVVYQVQLSNDLIDWSTLAILVSEEKSEGTTVRTYRDINPSKTVGRRFMRLRVHR